MKADGKDLSPGRKAHLAAEAALRFRATEYVGSYPRIEDCPDSSLIPVIAVTGRSNSGKSSLISAMCDHHNLARASGAPGKTRALNYFRVPQHSAPPHGLYLVDLPGYGFAKVSRGERRALRAMVDRFLAEVENMVVLVLVLDAKRKLESEEESIVAFCRQFGRPLILARTKWDRLNAKEKNVARKDWKERGLSEITLPVSSTKKTGIGELLKAVRSHLPGSDSQKAAT
ncbi:MAG: ribosome biogenesis GTP-binding protein YihA/YsxC [bacterium]|nr:ribosome biogenesis GTP-binding protein YihA/YsxC [bacterium]